MKKYLFAAIFFFAALAGSVSLSPGEVFAQSLYSGGLGLPKLVLCGPSYPPGPDRVCTIDHAFKTISNAIRFVIIILVPIAVGWFVWAGYLYITAAGDKGAVEKAKTTFKNVFIGFAIIFSAWIVIYTILNEILDTSNDFKPLQINATNQ